MNCNISEYLSVCTVFVIRCITEVICCIISKSRETSSQDIVHLSFCRIVFVYVFSSARGSIPSNFFYFFFLLKLAKWHH